MLGLIEDAAKAIGAKINETFDEFLEMDPSNKHQPEDRGKGVGESVKDFFDSIVSIQEDYENKVNTAATGYEAVSTTDGDKQAKDDKKQRESIDRLDSDSDSLL